MKHIESLEHRVNRLERQQENLEKKLTKSELRIHQRIDSFEKDMHNNFKEFEKNNKSDANDIIISVDNLSNKFNGYLIQEKDERIKEMKKQEKIKNGALYSLIVGFALMVLGTFWDMFIQPIIDLITKG